jgi:uncharacterized protein
MIVPRFSWPLVDAFVDRTDEQAQLLAWWEEATREPIALIGRRRVGKSWLFRRFAHGKPAVILVAEQLPAHSQLTRFADILEPLLGVRPDLPNVQTLIRLLFRMAKEQKVLAVIDEFPWMLGTSTTEARQTLTSIAAVMEEERDSSQLKLILCGSQVAQMESLFTEKNPMHGRLRRMSVRPLAYRDARLFLGDLDPIAAFERFAIAGGMPMYLSRLASGSVRKAVCNVMLNRDALLFNEGRAIVEQELREPRVYFAILEQLAHGGAQANEIGQRISLESNAVHKYLIKLEELRLVSKHVPFGADAEARSGRWRLDDEFLRFWFRFVFPFQSDLETGLVPTALFDAEIAGVIAEHVSTSFESWCRQWLRTNSTSGATKFGTWWGNAADEFRRTKERSSEEIDAVGSLRNKVVVVAEAKWTAAPLGTAIVDDLENYKIPALRQNLKVAARPDIVLFSKSGYTPALHALAVRDSHITLVDVAQALGQQGES